MPYIDTETRERLDPAIDELSEQIETEGQLTYVIFSLLVQSWYESAQDFTVGNALMGVLSCTQAEFYRRILADYEDEAIERNGDVLP